MKFEYEFYIARSSKSGKFFTRHELASDGWGIYEDDISMIDLDDYKRAAIFSPHEVTAFKNKQIYLEEFKGHEDDQIQFVKVSAVVSK